MRRVRDGLRGRLAKATVGVLSAVLAAGVLAGCQRATTLGGRVDAIDDVIAQAERNGAYACAPRELALARAHADFARNELGQGDVSRAEAHFVIAEPNARAALTLSPPERCAPRGVVVADAGDRDGDGFLDPDDSCPDEPEDFDGFDDEDGCPEEQDVDGDGITDARDLCPLEPEDVDGYLDTDGCPEVDNDLDGVPDESDACALQPEDPDGVQDEDGCPDLDNDADSLPDTSDQCPNEPGPPGNDGCPRVYQDVEVTTTHIHIRQKIFFETNRARIRARSFGILDTVVQVLNDYPQITVEIQGHTDSRGSDSHNLELSDDRAGAVREYLVEHGIGPERLTARGYGETRPIESNRTSSGRAANRRVEFVRTDEGAQAQPAGTPSAGGSDVQTPEESQ